MTRGDILGHRIYAHGNICKQNTFVSILKSIAFYVYLLIKNSSIELFLMDLLIFNALELFFFLSRTFPS